MLPAALLLGAAWLATSGLRGGLPDELVGKPVAPASQLQPALPSETGGLPASPDRAAEAQERGFPAGDPPPVFAQPQQPVSEQPLSGQPAGLPASAQPSSAPFEVVSGPVRLPGTLAVPGALDPLGDSLSGYLPASGPDGINPATALLAAPGQSPFRVLAELSAADSGTSGVPSESPAAGLKPPADYEGAPPSLAAVNVDQNGVSVSTDAFSPTPPASILAAEPAVVLGLPVPTSALPRPNLGDPRFGAVVPEPEVVGRVEPVAGLTGPVRAPPVPSQVISGQPVPGPVFPGPPVSGPVVITPPGQVLSPEQVRLETPLGRAQSAVAAALSARQVSLETVILGPVNTAIIKAADGYQVVAEGAAVPETGLTLIKVLPDRVRFVKTGTPFNSGVTVLLGTGGELTPVAVPSPNAPSPAADQPRVIPAPSPISAPAPAAAPR